MGQLKKQSTVRHIRLLKNVSSIVGESGTSFRRVFPPKPKSRPRKIALEYAEEGIN